MTTEIEFTLFLPINTQLINYNLSCFKKKMTKYLFENNIRKLEFAKLGTDDKQIFVQHKKSSIKSLETCLIFKNLLKIQYKESLETTYNQSIKDRKLLKTIERRFFFEKKLRWALDKDIDTNIYQISCEQESCSYSDFCLNLKNSTFIKQFLQFSFHVFPVDSRYLIQLPLIGVRKFIYPMTSYEANFEYYSPKLNGVKYDGFIHLNKIIIPETSFQFTQNESFFLNNQIFFCQFEFIQNSYYLIDITKVIDSSDKNGLYCEVSIFDSIHFMNIINISQSTVFKVNTFSKDVEHILTIAKSDESKYDGYLGFTSTFICKYKWIATVDLLYKLPKQKKKNINECLFFNCGKSLSETDYSYGGEHFDIGDNGFAIYEFQIIEKNLKFFKQRFDKSVPNNYETFLDILNFNKY